MALIHCPECNTSISDKAPTCPACGSPLKQTVQTIEKTSKTLKAQQLIAALLFVFSMISCTAQSSEGIKPTGSLIVFSLSGLWMIAVRLLIWWKHE